MIDLRRAARVAMVVTPLTVVAAPQQDGPPAAQQPAAQQPAAPPAAQAVPGTVTCPAPTPPATMPDRQFTAPAGMMLIPVLSTKVADFEKFLGYVREALAKTTDGTVREQAKGWRFFKIPEPGPNGDVLFAFLIDPAVTCVDYGLAPILNAAFPDGKQLEEVWNLYRSAVRNGGFLMNFIPVTSAGDVAAAPPAPQTPGPVPGTPPGQPLPLDSNPTRPPR